VHDVRLDANGATEWIITTAISQISTKSSKVSTADGLKFFNAHFFTFTLAKNIVD
jgi:hypothetical protein